MRCVIGGMPWQRGVVVVQIALIQDVPARTALALWPDAAGVASGRPYHSVLNIKLSSGQYETANVTVQGGGTQSVSVPAGTYRATLVNMTMVTKVGSFTTTAVVKVWTAPGTGPVKTEQLIRAAGKTQFITTSALVSFTKQAAGS